jgi:hypothetical protein
MTEDIMPEAVLKMFDPALITPASLYLVSEEAPTNTILGAGAGVVHAAHVTLTNGVLLGPDERNPEGVAAHIEAITDRAGESVPQTGAEQSMHVIKLLQGG